MELIFQLVAYLILAFLGVVAPFIIILLSIYQEGGSILRSKYENERNQSESNFKEQQKNLAEAKTTNIDEIEKSIKSLKEEKRKAEYKLKYLNPRSQTLNLFCPPLIAFIMVLILVLLYSNIYCLVIFGLIIIALLVRSIYVLWRLIGIITETIKAIDDEKNLFKENRIKGEEKTIELLSALVKKEGPYFLKAVYPIFGDTIIDKDDKSIKTRLNEKGEFKIVINNHEKRMAKIVEMGFCFPEEFVIEKEESLNYKSIYVGEMGQIIRYETSSIQSNTNQEIGALVITPVKKGSYSIKSFIKAENIETVYRYFTIVVE
ncbi:MAG: hypothetical protein PHG97_00415 [Candidatus Margulisbacteria bacterium]|nr:hypothetical protein [Candidatus Margulisiibacteriota bacterium]